MIDNKQLYDILIVDPNRIERVEAIVRRIRDGQHRYEAVAEALNMPWQPIAVIHYRESGMSFNRHQHNGDPLTARTVHVPAGRPIKGTPPFLWEESAIDALTMKGFDKVTDWSIGPMLDLLEKYNGLGYRKKGLPSPYIWSYSQNYHKGKYVADGKFDPEAVDQQCGVAVLLKQLL